MTRDQIEAFYPLSFAMRRLFHKLRHGIGQLHQSTGISPGMRAVLESVIEGGPMTVPQMARVRPVTRQHIQGLVNALLDDGYVEYLDNPAHKRSSLVSATEHGHKVFKEMRAREIEAFGHIALDVTPQEFAAADRVLRALIGTLDSPQWQSVVDRYANETKS
jgi:DNA-binding MarR family transcriptional regulator